MALAGGEVVGHGGGLFVLPLVVSRSAGPVLGSAGAGGPGRHIDILGHHIGAHGHYLGQELDYIVTA